jgi:subtilase family serine protease
MAVARILGALLAAALVAASLIPDSASPTSSHRARLAGSVPPWATSANFRQRSPATDYVGFRVYLGWRNQSAAEAHLRAVSDPASPSYGQFMTPQQFRHDYAPTSGDVNAVRSWLQDHGFTVVYTPVNNHYVAAEGTVAETEETFETQLNDYEVEGLTLSAPGTELSVPESLGASVSGVIGLDQSDDLIQSDIAGTDAPPPRAFLNAPPCAAYWNQLTTADVPPAQGVTVPRAYGQRNFPYVPCGYTPSQLRGAYGLSGAIASGIDGSDQTVAIIGAYGSATLLDDLNEYSRRHGLPTVSPSDFTQDVAPGAFHHPQRGQPIQNPNAWAVEEHLDVEAVHSIAPRAKIIVVAAPNQEQDLDAAINHAVDQRQARIVSNSWGLATEFLPRGWIKPLNDTFIQAALEGIGVYFSSGDFGDGIDFFGVRSTSWPASSPYVTAVGGTSLGVGAQDEYVFETGWGTGASFLVDGAWSPTPPGRFALGSGGGTSRLFAQPFYQQGVVPDSLSDYFHVGARFRVVPDVALVGDPNTGFVMGITQTFPDESIRYSEFRNGGTSLSAPLMAGTMALADQAKGSPHGFANPALYAAAGTNAYRDIVDPPSTVAAVRVDFRNFVDASAGLFISLRTMNFTGTLHTISGYDDVTGIGTPNGASFLGALD